MIQRSELPWVLRALWASLAVAAGPAFAQALDGGSRAVQLVAAIGLWGAWAVGLVATLVPTTVTLTAVRLLAAGAVAASAWAWLAGASAVAGAVAVAVSVAVAAVATTAEIGRIFVQGSAYGDEWRFPLRPPGLLLAGPLPLLVALVLAGVTAGPLLLAARLWVAGAIALAVGWPLAVLVVRRLHELSRRWVVLVPAGFVVHDPLGLADTVLVRRPALTSVGLAPADTDAVDLTAGALGLAIEVRSEEPVTVVLAGDRRSPRGRLVNGTALLVAPSRPGAVLAACADRRLPVIAATRR